MNKMADPLCILADENIPFVREAFGKEGKVHLVPGRAIRSGAIDHTDVLLVRSVTPITPMLLQDNTQIQFIGSATSGTDHVDRAYLKGRRIPFVHAPGSNANSVVEYVMAALLHLAVRKGQHLYGKTIGIVGCGNIGRRLANRLPALGLRVLKNDPPRAEEAERAGRVHNFLPLRALLEEADIITLHVPLTQVGPHATYHLFDEDVLTAMKDEAWLVNASRGAVVDNAALLKQRQEIEAAVLDVWENEPTPSLELLQCVDLATPHVAGYCYDGKVQGTIMLYRALMDHLGRAPSWDYEAALKPPEPLTVAPPDPALPATDGLNLLVRQMYDIVADDRRLRRILDQPEGERGRYFSQLRKTYPRRRAFSRHVMPSALAPEPYRAAVQDGLRVCL